MATRNPDSTTMTPLPRSLLILVLIGLPALYVVHSLFPWSVGLLQRHDHSYFWPFWVLIAVLHWSSVAIVIVLLKRVGRGLTDIGLRSSPLGVAAMIGIPLVVGLVLTLLHGASGSGQQASVVSPATLGERLFWIFMSITAGFCEELVYRGFYVRTLQGHKMRTWLAVLVATLAFVLMHGVTALTLTASLTIFVAGLVFSGIFLWRRSLVPGICLHALIDVASIGFP